MRANPNLASRRAAARFARIGPELRAEIIGSYRENMGVPGFHEQLWGALREKGIDDTEIDALFVELGRLAVH